MKDKIEVLKDRIEFQRKILGFCFMDTPEKARLAEAIKKNEALLKRLEHEMQ